MPLSLPRMAAPRVLSTALLVLVLMGAGQGAQNDGRVPPWSKVKQTVADYFSTVPGYQPGNLIVRSEVETLLGRLKQIGWTVPNRSSLLERLCTDSEFLAQELRTTAGRRFMQRIASYSGGYDCLDRLSDLPHGRQTVHDLIYKVGGERMIEYMTTTSGGRSMEKMLAQTPRGGDFGKPTGRIYTVNALLEELQKRYVAARRTA